MLPLEYLLYENWPLMIQNQIKLVFIKATLPMVRNNVIFLRGTARVAKKVKLVKENNIFRLIWQCRKHYKNIWLSGIGRTDSENRSLILNEQTNE